jgi:hypothetical protein
MKTQESAFEVFVLFVLGAAIVLAFSGCGASNIMTDAAQATYAAELQACVHKSATRADADACIHETRVNWEPLSGRDAGDSGSDAGAKDASK